MVSYFKTQWFNLLVGLVSLGLAVFYLCFGNVDTAIMWVISCCVWLGMSRIEYNDERIQLLEAKAEKYDALVDKVDALQELLETEHKYSDHLNRKIDSLVYEVRKLKK